MSPPQADGLSLPSARLSFFGTLDRPVGGWCLLHKATTKVPSSRSRRAYGSEVILCQVGTAKGSESATVASIRTRDLGLYIVDGTEGTTMTVINKGAMSIYNFSRWAGIGRSLVYKEIAAGRLRVKKVGRRTLITRDAAETWLSELPEANRCETR